jgi:hypothetical protein
MKSFCSHTPQQGPHQLTIMTSRSQSYSDSPRPASVGLTSSGTAAEHSLHSLTLLEPPSKRMGRSAAGGVHTAQKMLRQRLKHKGTRKTGYFTG